MALELVNVERFRWCVGVSVAEHRVATALSLREPFAGLWMGLLFAVWLLATAALAFGHLCLRWLDALVWCVFGKPSVSEELQINISTGQ